MVLAQQALLKIFSPPIFTEMWCYGRDGDGHPCVQSLVVCLSSTPRPPHSFPALDFLWECPGAGSELDPTCPPHRLHLHPSRSARQPLPHLPLALWLLLHSPNTLLWVFNLLHYLFLALHSSRGGQLPFPANLTHCQPCHLPTLASAHFSLSPHLLTGFSALFARPGSRACIKSSGPCPCPPLRCDAAADQL